MYQYKTPETLCPQLDQLFLLSGQTPQNPLNLVSQSQSDRQVTHPSLKQLNQPKETDLPFESLAEPTKRIKHNQQLSTKASSSKSSKKANLPSDLTMKDDLHTISADGSIQGVSPNIPSFGDDLVIPGLNSLNQGNMQMFPIHAYQKMMQQLEQQRAQYQIQQQLMMQVARQKMKYGGFDYSQFQVDPKMAQLYQGAEHEYEFHKIKSELKSEDPAYPEDVRKQTGNSKLMTTEKGSEELKTNSTADVLESKAENSEDEDGFQYIKIENSNDKLLSGLGEETRSTKKSEKSEIEASKRKTQGPKRYNSEQYWTEYSKMLGDNIHKKMKDEPRNKNRWQSKDGEDRSRADNQDNLHQTASNERLEIEKETVKATQKTKVQKQPKTEKPVDIPQHMQDDSTMDYENLISITITDDPVYASPENSKNKFVMICKNTNPECIQARDTRIGDRYQVAVSEYKGRVAGKKRNPKTIWKPEIVKKNELKAYFDELCRIFSCKNINQEEALRLLKSKKYRKERVAVNIGKSRKFYAKVLVAPGENNQDVNDTEA